MTALGRREFLRCGLAGLTSLTMAELFRLRGQASPPPSGPRQALILVWLQGGASHLETYDPKPSAPSEYRGPFAPIDSCVNGMRLCELLPAHARVADRFTLLRSMVHTGFCHQQGTQQLLTGHEIRELRNKPDHPDLFSVAHRLRASPGRVIPNYVGVPAVAYGGAAYLGSAFEPFNVTGDPNAPEFHVPNVGVPDASRDARLGERLTLRRQFDQLRRFADARDQMGALDMYEGQAWSMLTSDAARRAFDLTLEDEATRDRYGRNRWGQQCLLARRLVEAGVELVTTQLNGSLCGRVGNWDDHAVNHHVFDAMKYRAPLFDQAVAALIEDVYARGLDRHVMVVVTGEFGRTPKISYQASTGEGIGSGTLGTVQPGRDHWPRATSILFAGGGMRTGQVIGATDRRGEDANERIVGRGDFLATLYRHLDIDPTRVAFSDFSGRPIPILPEGGTPISELVAVA